MKRIAMVLAGAALLVTATETPARDTIHKLKISDFMSNTGYTSRLEGVSFYFGDQPHPTIVKSFGEYRTNKKTNAFNKSDEEACEWVMLSAMLSLHERAISLGANAVVNIRSNYKNNVESSATEYTCGAGAFVSGVALIGDFVTVEGG